MSVHVDLKKKTKQKQSLKKKLSAIRWSAGGSVSAKQPTYLIYMEGVDNIPLPYSKVECVVGFVVLYSMDYVIKLQAQLLVGNNLCVMATPCVDMDRWRILPLSNKQKVTAAGYSIVVASPVRQLDVIICNISILHNCYGYRYIYSCWKK